MDCFGFFIYWLNFTHFLGYKLKIKLILRSIKREDQALISKFTILKFAALNIFVEILLANILEF